MTDALMSNYARLPVTFVRGAGAWLWDEQGKQYLDALSGIAVTSLGHAHPAVTQAICEQAGDLLHTSNLYQIAPQQQLAQRLCQLSGMDNAFFCNSGAEANEAAIKLARLYGHRLDQRQPGIIVTEGSFHGRTLATLSATGSRKVQAGFEPLVTGFKRAPYGDLEAMRLVGENNADVVAVMLEPIKGEAGIVLPDEGYLRELRALCDEKQWLLILDEIQTGIGRTGRWFAYQHEDILPDVITLAKALGNGVPIGACLARGTAATLFQPGNHGSTFGGNHLACKAALAVLDTIEQKNLLQHAEQLGQQLLEGLQRELGEMPEVRNIRGRGLMLAVELDRDCPELVSLALEQGLLINVTAGNVIRLLPPLILSNQEAEQIIHKLTDIVRAYLTARQP